MKEPLKEGMRVKLCGYAHGGVCVDGLKAEVLCLADSDGDIIVRTSQGQHFVKESQMVRLRKHPRRRVWVSKRRVCAQDGNAAIIFFDEPSTPSDWVEFVEVRKAKGEK